MVVSIKKLIIYYTFFFPAITLRRKVVSKPLSFGKFQSILIIICHIQLLISMQKFLLSSFDFNKDITSLARQLIIPWFAFSSWLIMLIKYIYYIFVLHELSSLQEYRYCLSIIDAAFFVYFYKLFIEINKLNRGLILIYLDAKCLF